MIIAGIFDDISSATETIKAIGLWLQSAALWLYAPVQWLIDWWPMLGHFILFAGFVILCGFIARFLPDRVKGWLLILIGLAGAFIAGEVNQYRQRLASDKARAAAEKKKPKMPPTPKPERDPWRW